MSDDFDPYHRWLGIHPKHLPADHYRLLGIELFEADPEVIRDATERQSGHVRRYALGQHGPLCQRILNEIAVAKACLLDPVKKAEYDAAIQRPAAAASVPVVPVATLSSAPARPIQPLPVPLVSPAPTTRSRTSASSDRVRKPARVLRRQGGETRSILERVTPEWLEQYLAAWAGDDRPWLLPVLRSLALGIPAALLIVVLAAVFAGITASPENPDSHSTILAGFPNEPKILRATPERVPQLVPSEAGSAQINETLHVGEREVKKTEPPSPTSYTNSIGMKLALIPAGEFQMGSPPDDSGADSAEKPQHTVRITKPFYLGVTEVTQEQYERVTGQNPSHFKGDPQRPVEVVSWEDAVAFCRKLSEKEGRTYRLPTEAEWEYACRAGSKTTSLFGDDESALKEFAWYGGNSKGMTHPVGERKPNTWGLCDMHGNVWEWCSDWSGSGYYGESPVDDPTGPTAGSLRVVRGLSWCFVARIFRSANRYWYAPEYRCGDLGFRVGLSLVDESRR